MEKLAKHFSRPTYFVDPGTTCLSEI